jgi:hypothetical protein
MYFFLPWVLLDVICVAAVPVAAMREKRKRINVAGPVAQESAEEMDGEEALIEAESFGDDGFGEISIEAEEVSDADAEFEGFK